VLTFAPSLPGHGERAVALGEGLVDGVRRISRRNLDTSAGGATIDLVASHDGADYLRLGGQRPTPRHDSGKPTTLLHPSVTVPACQSDQNTTSSVSHS
jgi:hypothetical protein